MREIKHFCSLQPRVSEKGQHTSASFGLYRNQGMPGISGLGVHVLNTQPFAASSAASMHAGIPSASLQGFTTRCCPFIFEMLVLTCPSQ